MIIFLFVTTIVILLLAIFVVSLIYLYQKKQIAYLKNLDALKHNHEKNILSAQLEIQESTFQHISREIHDNISLSLTLAKLNLHTLDWDDREKSTGKVNSSIELLGQSINDLSDISKSLNADVIIQHGLIKALEDEVLRIRQTGLFNISFVLTGNPVYLDAQKELIIFRIVQEAFNNIIKHAKASRADLKLHYNTLELNITIGDNGNGFDTDLATFGRQAGLKNMTSRIKMLQGTMKINSRPGQGTSLLFTIPFE